jgi:chitinase
LKKDVFIEDGKCIPLSVKQMAWLKEEGFGGIMIWSVDMDDFRGQCGTGKYPLINAMRQELEGYTVKLEYDGPYEGTGGGGAYTTKDRK